MSAEQLALCTPAGLRQHPSKYAAGSKRACQHLPEEQLARSKSRRDVSRADEKRRYSQGTRYILPQRPSGFARVLSR